MPETSTAPVTGPMDNLPSPYTKRWVVRRKAAVLAAVRNGDLTVEEACRRYGLSEEELQAWHRAFDADGLRGLRATRVPAHRTSPRR